MVSENHILVVEDDPTVAEIVTRYLEHDGFTVEVVGDGRTALRRFAANRPDLVLLDVMLPGVDGLEVLRRVRRAGRVPVVVLTARADEADRVGGLELGADDYVVKPFSPREVVARVRAVLRRSHERYGEEDGSRVEHGGLVVDIPARRATLRGTDIALTAKEFDLLAFLARHPSRVFAREDLLREVWGYTYGDTATVTVHIRRLREKIEADPSRPALIQTVWGVGYRFGP